MQPPIPFLPDVARKAFVLGLLSLAYAAFGPTPLYAQNLTLLSVNPTSAAPGVAVSVLASGFTLNVPAGPVVVTLTPQFAGVAVTAIGVVQGSGTGRSINFIQPSGTPGMYSLSISGPGIISNNSLNLTLLGDPTFSLAPTSGTQGQTVQVTISPQNTTFLAGSTANFGPGISVGGAAEGAAGPVVNQPNGTLIATLVINPEAATGFRTVVVNSGGAITLADSFTVLQRLRTLVLTGIEPASGPAGAAATISATGFEAGVVAPPMTVTLVPQAGGAPITVPATTTGTGAARTLTFTMPIGSPVGAYNATVAGTNYVSGNVVVYNVTSPLVLLSITPPSAPVNAAVSILASGFAVNDTPTLIVTLTPNGGGVPVTVPASVQGPGANRSINFIVPVGTALGAYTVTAAGSGYVSSNSLPFSVTGAPSFTLNPPTGQPGTTIQVTITGANTTFPAGVTTASFGPGISVGGAAEGGFGPVVVQPNGTAIATLTINAGAALGARTVQVNGLDAIVQANAFTVVQQTQLTLISITPPSASVGAAVSILASGFIVNDTPSLTITLTPTGGGAPVTIPASVQGTGINRSLNFVVPVDAAVGGYTVTVAGSGYASSNSLPFTVSGAPSFSLNPPTGAAGAAIQVVITPVNTTFPAGGTTANFGPGISVGGGVAGQAGPVVVQSNGTAIAALSIDPAAAIGPRTVIVNGVDQITRPNAFAVTAALLQSIRGVSPSTGEQNQTLAVTITGLNTQFTNQSIVSFGAGVTINGVVANSDTSLLANITIAPGATVGPRDVVVTTNGIPVTGSGLFAVTAASVRQILSVVPGTGVQGATLAVVITGSNTNFSGASIVSFGSGVTVNSVTYISPTSLSANISVDANATLGARNVVVTTGAEVVTGAGLFTVQGAPQITSINPNSGARGQTMTVTITGSATSFAQGTSTVSFGAGITVNSVTVASATSLTVNISVASDAALGGRTVAVTTGAQAVSLENGFTVLATAQTSALTCNINVGVPPTLRAEGFTELTGDLIFVCTGGTAGQTRDINLQLFLNVPITSRIVGSQSEALLIVDELSGAVYRATPGEGQTSLVWPGVSFVEPGPGSQRTLRVTNVRANVAVLAASASIVPSQVFAFISISPSQALPLTQAQYSVGFVLPGLAFDVTNCAGATATPNAFAQCVGENSSGNRNLISGATGTMQFGVRFREGFHSSFKRQLAPGQSTSVPGFVYNSESGFLRPELPFGVGGADSGTRLVARFNNIPNGVRLFVTTRPSGGSSTGLDAVLVQAGANAAGGALQPNSPIAISGTVTLFCPLSNSEGVSAAEIPVVNNSAMAVWEITSADMSVLETAVFGVAVAYVPNLPNQQPGLGQASVGGSFGPFYAASSNAGRMSSSLPIPRFIDAPTIVNVFRIDSCVTNILFPFVTNREGFDTGIAISNTSVDPFGAAQRQQAGACTLNYYGSTASGPAPASQRTTALVAGGSTLAFVLSSGGNHGIAATPGFQGYIIAQCDFRYGHGFAFITDGPIGTARVAEGYLGLVMDSAIPTRGSSSETLSH